jgi:hypothetical protein
MELRDLIVTPLVIIVVFVVAWLVRGRVTDINIRKYFMPALTVRIIGALAVGFLYQFYYEGGDTYNYHTRGSRHVWEAFMSNPETGLRLLVANGQDSPGTYKYSSQIPFFRDPASYFVIRVSSLFDFVTFSSYSATAVLFSVISFSGAWCLFMAFYRQTPQHHLWLAMATLFIPSVVFWGSGLLKDTLTLAGVGFMTYSISNLFLLRRINVKSILLLMISAWVIFVVKKYILLCFLPAAFFWIYTRQLTAIRSMVLRLMLIPFVLLFLGGSGYYAIQWVGRDDPRYSLDKIAVTAQITAYDIGFYTGRDAGSTYDLGTLDGTFSNMLSKFPQAVNVSLFRPYLWEVRNPLMLLSALESVVLLLFTLVVVYRIRFRVARIMREPTILFCLIFSIMFAFAVGVSTFNFGTLTRYKIPLMPFYALALVYAYQLSKSEQKPEVLEMTE